MPFTEDTTASQYLTGQTSASLSPQTVPQNIEIKVPGLLGSIAKSVWSDLSDYPKMVMEGGRQAVKVLADPYYRNIVQKTNTGTPLTPEEAKYVLAQPGGGGKYLSPQELNKFSTLKGGLLEGGKRTARFASYVAPAAIGTPGVAQGSFKLAGMARMPAAAGMSAGKALMYAPSAANLGLKGFTKLMGTRGMASGALQGFGTSETGQEIPSTIIGGGLGYGTGALMGNLIGRVQLKGAEKAAKIAEITKAQQTTPATEATGRTVASIWNPPGRKGYSYLDPQKTGRDLWNMGIFKNNQIKTYEQLDDVADDALDTLGKMVKETLDQSDQRIEPGQALDAARKILQQKGLDTTQANSILNGVETSMGVGGGGGTSALQQTFKQSMGLSAGDANRAVIAAQSVRNVASSMGTSLDPMTFNLAYQNALKSVGFTDDVAQSIANQAQTSLFTGGSVSGAGGITMSASDALQASRNLGMASADYWTDHFYTPKDPLMAAKYSAFKAANDNIREQLNRATQKIMIDPNALTEARLLHLQEISPELAAKVLRSPTVGGWRSLMAPLIQAKELNYLTAKEAAKASQHLVQRVVSSVLMGAGASTLGPLGWPVGMVGGAAVAPMLLSPFNQGMEAMRVPGTIKAAQAIQSLGTGGISKVVQGTQGRLLNALGTVGVRALPVATRAVREAVIKDQQRKDALGGQ
jgi:hypothetical protein